MKIIRYILALVIIAGFLPNVAAEPPYAFHSEWVLVRETADEDGGSFAAVYDLTGLSATISGGNFAGKDSSTVVNGGAYQISPRAGVSNRWMFVFCAKNYNNVDDIFSFNLVGWSKTNGMLQNIVEGDCVIGTQAVVVYPDSGDALGELISETGVTYATSNDVYTVTNEGFDGAVVGMLARVITDNDSNLTSGFYQVTTVTDTNNIRMSGTTSSNGTTCSVQMNPAFWVDTINIDETTKWTSTIAHDAAASGNKGVLEVINSGDNEVAALVVDLTGIEWIQFVVYVADAATSEEAGDITVYGRKF